MAKVVPVTAGAPSTVYDPLRKDWAAPAIVVTLPALSPWAGFVVTVAVTVVPAVVPDSARLVTVTVPPGLVAVAVSVIVGDSFRV